MSRYGVRTVMRQEFRLRLRAGRWRWLLGTWVLVLLVVTALLVAAADSAFRGVQIADGLPVPLGPTVFGFLMLFLLSLALLVVPALTAQSINGDRDRGTLATVQVTLLAPVEIALGKFLAAWGTALVFLAAGLPMVGWAVALGGVGVVRASAVLGVVALLLGVVAALSLALSALLARTTTSAVLAYLTVFALVVGTLVVFGLMTPTTAETRPVTYTEPVWDDPLRADYDAQGDPIAPDRFETRTYDETVLHTERVWWLLAPNPFVILADAAPGLPAVIDSRTGRAVDPGGLEPLGEIKYAVRTARAGPDDLPRSTGGWLPQEPEQGLAVWPWGLGFDVLLAAGALWVTTRRLRTPTRTLPRGTRVA
ncbi:MAG: ABC transporter permease [Pseudonocardia sp.]